MKNKSVIVTAAMIGIIASAVFFTYTCCPSPKNIRPENPSLKQLTEIFDRTKDFTENDIRIITGLVQEIIDVKNFQAPSLTADIIYAYPRFQNDSYTKACMAKLLVYLGAKEAIPLFEKDSALPKDIAQAYIEELNEAISVDVQMKQLQGEVKAVKGIEILSARLKGEAGKRYVKEHFIRLGNACLAPVENALKHADFPEKELLFSVLRNINTPEAEKLLHMNN